MSVFEKSPELRKLHETLVRAQKLIGELPENIMHWCKCFVTDFCCTGIGFGCHSIRFDPCPGRFPPCHGRFDPDCPGMWFRCPGMFDPVPDIINIRELLEWQLEASIELVELVAIQERIRQIDPTFLEDRNKRLERLRPKKKQSD